MSSLSAQFTVRVAAITAVAAAIKRFRLVSVGEALPPFSAGSHVTVTMKTPQGRTIRNSYSLMGNRHDTAQGYEISVLRTQNSRGGSEFLHDAVKLGNELTMSGPSNLFPLDRRGKKFVLLAGGIGITPIMAMADYLSEQNLAFELHYGFRNRTHAAFVDELAARYGARLVLYEQDQGKMLPMDDILRHQKLGTHLYVCGPAAMIESALAAGRRAGWPESSLHSERFQAAAGGAPFQAILTRSHQTITVGETQSLLEAVEEAGVSAPYLCRGGACGQCECRVSAVDGVIEHHDHVLSESDRAQAQKIMICVSRVKGKSISLDL
ncbi:MAG: PDR/VanB family oxidoreductase [Candidatus Symbiobacter sp.]|nr:PDR/VanB family oxidoreductase [Candidatus Symbiobacter sp.]